MHEAQPHLQGKTAGESAQALQDKISEEDSQVSYNGSMEPHTDIRQRGSVYTLKHYCQRPSPRACPFFVFYQHVVDTRQTIKGKTQ